MEAETAEAETDQLSTIPDPLLPVDDIDRPATARGVAARAARWDGEIPQPCVAMPRTLLVTERVSGEEGRMDAELAAWPRWGHCSRAVHGSGRLVGRNWRPTAEPVLVNVHDFADPQLGKAVPYGIYDLAADTGWVNVGAGHHTAAFAVESVRRWVARPGPVRLPAVAADGSHPSSTSTHVTTDRDGSTPSRNTVSCSRSSTMTHGDGVPSGAVST